MVGEAGKGTRNGDDLLPTRTSRATKYFYLNKKLHKIIVTNRPADLVTAWCYPCRKRHHYVLSDVRKHSQKAFNMSEVTRFIGRHRVAIEGDILSGNIPQPQKTYSLDGRFSPGKYKFSEDDVIALHEYLLTVHVGRPRKDGLIKPGKLPTRAELRAMMKNHEMLYVRNKDGEFTPIWKEADWS